MTTPRRLLAGFAAFCLVLGTAGAAAADEKDPIELLEENDTEEAPAYGWFQSLVGGLTLSQTEFEHWSQGGESALTWNLLALYNLDELRPRREWRTEVELQFGQSKQGDRGVRKAADRIRLLSVHAWTDRWVLDPFLSLEARSQFAKGYEYPVPDDDDARTEVSKFANPLYLNVAGGLMKTFSPGFSTRLGASLHTTNVTDEAFAPAYTDDPATSDLEKTRSDAGAEWATDFDKSYEDGKYRIKSYLNLFSSFDDLATVDMYWNTKVAANVISIIGVIMEFDVIYDEDVLPRTQFRETLSIGITHTFL